MNQKLQGNVYAVFGLLFSWLLFFPNAPYILTDLFHLKANLNMPIWFDLILILSFAWVGLLFGYSSLFDIELLLGKHLNKKQIATLISVLLFVAAFGIYLGRYLRWNSWDIMNNTSGLVYDIADRIISPTSHPRTWGVTIFMGLFLNMIYWSLRLLKPRSTVGN